MRYSKLFLILLFFISPFALAKNQLFYYEPKIVELTGIVKCWTFSTPRTHIGMQEGDESGFSCYLILKNPIDVDNAPGTKPMGNNAYEKNIKILELYELNRDWSKLRDGDCIRATGKLSHAIFWHQNTRVQLETKKIEFLFQEKMSTDNLAITQEDYKFMVVNKARKSELILKVNHSDK